MAYGTEYTGSAYGDPQWYRNERCWNCDAPETAAARRRARRQRRRTDRRAGAEVNA